MTKFRELCGTLALLALLFAPTQVPAADSAAELRNAIATQRALPRAARRACIMKWSTRDVAAMPFDGPLQLLVRRGGFIN